MAKKDRKEGYTEIAELMLQGKNKEAYDALVHMCADDVERFILRPYDEKTQPSDLEIVQRALTKTNYDLSADDEGWYLHYIADDMQGIQCAGKFKSTESLLTWAKQTVGEK